MAARLLGCGSAPHPTQRTAMPSSLLTRRSATAQGLRGRTLRITYKGEATDTAAADRARMMLELAARVATFLMQLPDLADGRGVLQSTFVPQVV
jgi:hypothetical protein